jgi:hypothetical protein
MVIAIVDQEGLLEDGTLISPPPYSRRLVYGYHQIQSQRRWEMIERSMELVVQAAREWAARSNKNDAIAATNAQETIAALKAKLTGEEYDRALESLYREYDES